MYYKVRNLPTPGTVIYFEINTSNCVKRASTEKDLYNFRSNLDFQIKFNNAMRYLSKHHIEVKIINANQQPKDLFNSVTNFIQGLI